TTLSLYPVTGTQSDNPFSLVAVDWSPDGKWIAVGGGTERCSWSDPEAFALQVIDAATGDLIYSFDGGPCNVTDVHWSLDGSKLAASVYDGDGVYIWDTTDWQLLVTQHSNTIAESYINWSPDGNWIVSTPITGGMHLMDAMNGIAKFISGGASPVWNPSGDRVASIAEEYIIITDPFTDERFPEKIISSDAGITLDWSPDGAKLALGDMHNNIQIRDTTNFEVITTLQGHTDLVYSVAWKSGELTDSTYLASVSIDGTVRVWDTRLGIELSEVQTGGQVYDVDWSPDGTQLAYVGGEDGGLHIIPAPGLDDLINATPDTTPSPTYTDTR
ncbi:MAG TPA: hypothetical protein VHL11_11850, partial [Phototrophicaceae bacterium]|nr:hypothetical protein [Phototrophicaceae bacterium]